MPGDPKECREHAKRCWELASETTNPALKESLVEEGDATNQADGSKHRPRREHLRRHVRAKPFDVAKEMVRVPARWPDRDGQLDSERSNARGTDPQDQLGLLVAAAGGFRQPDDVGHRKKPIERFKAAGVPRDRIAFARDTYTSNFPGSPREFVARR